MFPVSPGTWDSGTGREARGLSSTGGAADPSGLTADIAGVLSCWGEEQSCPGRMS